jgi:hypothetical protein
MQNDLIISKLICFETNLYLKIKTSHASAMKKILNQIKGFTFL